MERLTYSLFHSVHTRIVVCTVYACVFYSLFHKHFMYKSNHITNVEICQHPLMRMRIYCFTRIIRILSFYFRPLIAAILLSDYPVPGITKVNNS